MEGLYISNITPEEQIRRLRDTNFLDSVEKEWFDILLPNWIYVSNFSSKTKLENLCKILRSTGLSPREFSRLPLHSVLSDKFIDRGDAMAAKVGYFMRKDTGSRANLLKADWYKNQESGDTGLYYSNTIKLSHSSVENMIKHNGASQLISSEQQLHSLLIIPASILLGYLISTLHERYLDDAEETYRVKWAFVVYLYTSTTSLFLYLFALVYSIIQIFISTLTIENDKLSAFYLNVPLCVRFLDFIASYLAFCWIDPFGQIVSTLQGHPHDSWSGIIVYSSILYVAFNLVVIFMCFMYYRLFNSYNEHSHHDIHGRITCPEDAIFNNCTDSDNTHNLGKIVWRWMKNPLYRHGKVMHLLNIMGQYRKISESKDFVGSYLGRIAEFLAEEDVKKMETNDNSLPPPQATNNNSANIVIRTPPVTHS